MAKISMSELRSRASTVDRGKLDATTEVDIRRHKTEDGYAEMQVPSETRVVVPPKELRIRLGLTQKEMAEALRIPIGTWRNWEQDRVALDPAARSLLDIVHRLPEAALTALGYRFAKTRIAEEREAV